MDWIKVKLGSGMTGERMIRASAVVEVRIKSQSVVTLIDERGMSFEWVTSGTMAEYASLANALELTEVA